MALRNIIKKIKFNKQKPEIFSIETVLGCNIQCPECAIGGGLITRDKGVMSFEKFKIIADKIKPYAKFVYLHLWGEPLLNKDIFKIIEYTSKFAATNISTNGMIVDKEMADKIVTSNVTDVIVSIDGTTQETYEKYRVGGNLEKAMQALNNLVEAKNKHSSQISITPQFIVFKHNEHEMDEFKRICNSYGLTPFFKPPYMRKNSQFQNVDNPLCIRPVYLIKEDLTENMKNCQNLKNVFTITLDGSVIICCNQHCNTINFGNIFEQDVMEIWKSKKYMKHRWNGQNGIFPKFCLTECLTYYHEIKDEKTLEGILSK